MILPPVPARFDELAEYNALMHRTEMVPAPEIGPGVMRIQPAPRPADDKFTPEYHVRMAVLQQDYRRWLRAQYQAAGYVVSELPGGGLLVLPPLPRRSLLAVLKGWLGL